MDGENVVRKKDRQALSVMIGVLSEEIQTQLDITRTAKEAWEIPKSMNIGAAQLKKSRHQALKHEFEMLVMGDEESVTDFSGKLLGIVTQMRNLGEQVDEGVIVSKLLRAAPEKLDPITSTPEQFGNIDSMSLEEAVGSLKIYKEKLQDRQ
ncbi:uncharacterized protein LOC144710554 [Wolffia australiana]